MDQREGRPRLPLEAADWSWGTARPLGPSPERIGGAQQPFPIPNRHSKRPVQQIRLLSRRVVEEVNGRQERIPTLIKIMSPKKTVLRHLTELHEETGAEQYTHPGDIRGFDPEDSRCKEAVNQLLRDRYINGRKGPDGGMVIALNVTRLRDVRREIRPWFATPLLWVGIALIAATGIAVSMI